MMDYEEKYKTALERAKEIINYYKSRNRNEAAIEDLQEIFPELKGSEDEGIRKALIKGFNEYLVSSSHYPKNAIKYWHGIVIEDILAWLEKQAKYKSPEEVLKIRQDLYQSGYNDGYKHGCEDTKKKGANPQVKSALEAIHEQKPDNANKVERKFKVGDYIVNDYCKGKVIELTTDAYLLDTEQGIPFSCEHNAHLWSIQDAKDGDVLVFDNNVCTMGTIICKSPTSYDTKSYCRLIDEHFIGKEENGWDSMLLVPATKEQKDFLFKRMEEEGYKWDDEHKELKKIEL